jgi:hypothetical protein
MAGSFCFWDSRSGSRANRNCQRLGIAQPGAMHQPQGMGSRNGGRFLPAFHNVPGEILFNRQAQQV